MTEDGFTAIYRSMRTAADPNSPTAIAAITALVAAGGVSSITIAGHSLGASLATLLGLDVALNSGSKNIDVFTYASPRVGEMFFEHTYNSMVPNTYRIHNRSDIVPNLPIFPYEHVGIDLELVPPFNSINASIVCWHILDTYLWLMDQQSGGDTLKLDANCQGPSYPGPK
jgi:hypothetical protein